MNQLIDKLAITIEELPTADSPTYEFDEPIYVLDAAIISVDNQTLDSVCEMAQGDDGGLQNAGQRLLTRVMKWFDGLDEDGPDEPPLVIPEDANVWMCLRRFDHNGCVWFTFQSDAEGKITEQF